jgi:hypothetical protein
MLAGAKWLPAYFLYTHQTIILAYFFTTGIIAHLIIHFFGGKAERFVLVYMSVSTIKLLLSFSVVTFIAVKLKETGLFFAMNFLLSYLIFTAFEIAQYLKLLKQNP